MRIDHDIPRRRRSTTVPGNRYGLCDGKPAYARETPQGSWLVKTHDPNHHLADLDGWRTLGADWPTLADARTATGLF